MHTYTVTHTYGKMSACLYVHPPASHATLFQVVQLAARAIPVESTEADQAPKTARRRRLLMLRRRRRREVRVPVVATVEIDTATKAMDKHECRSDRNACKYIFASGVHFLLVV